MKKGKELSLSPVKFLSDIIVNEIKGIKFSVGISQATFGKS
jgi:hypothetical protein